MALDNKFVVLNKYEDFNKAYIKDCSITSSGILKQDEIGLSACYLSKKIDSLEEGMRWMRVSVNSNSSYVNIIAFALDYELEDGKYKELYSSGYTSDELAEIICEEFKTIEIKNNIGLLHKLKGRYLYFLLRFSGKNQSLSEVYDIKIEFDIDSFTKYFPAIYRKNMYEDDFFYRLIMVYQDLYMDIEQKIDNKYLDYDPEVADREALLKLIKMLNFDECKIFNTEIIRKLLSNYSSIMQLKGSIKGLELITNLVIGKNIKVVEHYEMFDKSLSIQARKQLSKNFVDDVFFFTIFVENSDDISDIEKKNYILFLDNFVPIKSSYDVIFETNNKDEKIKLDVGCDLPVRL